MKKITAFLCIATILFAVNQYEEESGIINHFGYVNLGVGPLPFPLPTLGFGYRTQNDRHGMDLSAAGVMVAFDRAALKLSGRCLFYFSPNELKQFYGGIGPAASVIFAPSASSSWAGLGLSPEFVFGHEHLCCKGTKRFWEIVIDFPTLASNTHIYKWGNGGNLIYFPYIYAQYGWGF